MEINPQDLDLVYSQAFIDGAENGESDISDDRGPGDSLEPASSNREEAEASHDIKPIETSFHTTKWKRLRKQYNDRYLEIFNETHKDETLDDPADLLESQFGAVIWTSEEKKRLFAAVARYGRHDLPRISGAVGTKSLIETHVYIDAVTAAEVDRQLFMDHAKNIALCDIPAAIEVEGECEAELERAADALCAYQEQFDIEAGLNAGGRSWLVDRDVAAKIDADNDEKENSAHSTGETATHEVEEGSVGQDRVHDLQVFNLLVLLDLSEQFFMNHPQHIVHSHWKQVAEHGQRPCLTRDVIQTLFTLARDYLERALGLLLQLASSRLANQTTAGYKPTRKVRGSDVKAALDILNLPHDSWDFWTRLPRRAGLQVITGSHSKGETRHQNISLEDAEAVLSPRRGTRRRRSMSIGSQTSSGNSQSNDDEALFEAVPNDDYSDPDFTDFKDEDDDDDDHVKDADQSTEENSSSEDSQMAEGAPPLKQEETKVTLAPDDRRAYLEEAHEGFADRVDHIAQIKEEKHLWSALGKRPSSALDEDDRSYPGSRPKVLRKTNEELKGWSCTYQAKWERFGPKVSADDALDNAVDTQSMFETTEGDIDE